ncbi:hypothetical protein [Zhaonella formicivorans]|uniref:hypothetical protein n=1 Tax=Zhaonella formicivorans TaxID=2528593 RepID=UPI0010E8E143|nr:hypothetical protein [Zhaonella formicivorans]
MYDKEFGIYAWSKNVSFGHMLKTDQLIKFVQVFLLDVGKKCTEKITPFIGHIKCYVSAPDKKGFYCSLVDLQKGIVVQGMTGDVFSEATFYVNALVYGLTDKQVELALEKAGSKFVQVLVDNAVQKYNPGQERRV